MEKPLTIEGLHKSYGSIPALAGVDLEASRGEIVALLGANGAGKTTLVSIVAALIRPDSGRVRVKGEDPLAQPRRARRHLGFAPQETGVYTPLTVRENLRFFGELCGLRRSALSRRVEDVAEAFSLAPLLDRSARDLSGGERRRLHTAIALLHEPPLLLLDEPTVGVDVQTRANLLDAVRELAGAGSAILYSTHYLGEVEELGASVAVLDRGRIVARDSLRRLIRAHGYSAVELEFDGTPPPLAHPGATVLGKTVRVATDRPPAEQAAMILTALGPAARKVRAIDLVEPNLESVYLAMTGRPLASNGALGEARNGAA